MECLEKPVWTKYTRAELEQIQVSPLDEPSRKKVMENWDQVAKPLDGMGYFEGLLAKIGGITRTEHIEVSKKVVIVMCADNGIVEEHISQSNQDVTTAVAMAMGRGASSVGRMAQVIGADIIPVDIGINRETPMEGVLDKKIRCGSRNFRKEPAMTEEETIQAIATGIDLVFACKNKGYQILATGELGIGNTTTSSAVAAALLTCETEEVTGRGAGLSDEGLHHKQEVIRESIERYQLQQADAFTILATVGGLDIAGLTGVCIGAALAHIPVVLDGVISMVAALVAERLCPGTKDYLLASHKGKEPAIEKLQKELDVTPVIDGQMALGEGTGAVMMFPLLDMALAVYRSGTTFDGMQLEPYQRFGD